MPKIFVCYRRVDSRKDVGRIYDRLTLAFGSDNIFKDIDSIEPGADFRGVVKEAVSSCDVVLVVIGQNWLAVTDKSGNRRLENPNDYVRIEVETGLQRDKAIVIPLLVDGASMPSPDDLPSSIRDLTFKQSVSVRDDPDFN